MLVALFFSIVEWGYPQMVCRDVFCLKFSTHLVVVFLVCICVRELRSQLKNYTQLKHRTVFTFIGDFFRSRTQKWLRSMVIIGYNGSNFGTCQMSTMIQIHFDCQEMTTPKSSSPWWLSLGKFTIRKIVSNLYNILHSMMASHYMSYAKTHSETVNSMIIEYFLIFQNGDRFFVAFLHEMTAYY